MHVDSQIVENKTLIDCRRCQSECKRSRGIRIFDVDRKESCFALVHYSAAGIGCLRHDEIASAYDRARRSRYVQRLIRLPTVGIESHFQIFGSFDQFQCRSCHRSSSFTYPHANRPVECINTSFTSICIRVIISIIGRRYLHREIIIRSSRSTEIIVKNMIDRWCRLPNFRKIHLNNLWSIDIRQIKTLCRFERV